MSWQATWWAKGTRGHQSPSSKLVLMILADYAHPETHEAWPSVVQLAADCEISRRSVLRCLKSLESLGFVSRVRRGNQYHGSTYLVNHPTVGDNMSQAHTRASDTVLSSEGDAHVTNTPVHVTPVTGVGDTGVTRSIAREGIREESSAKKKRVSWSAPEWFNPLAELEGYQNRNWAGTSDKIRAACEGKGVDPAKVIQAFCDYWPIGRARHNWTSPPRALLGSIEVQISKTLNGRAKSYDPRTQLERIQDEAREYAPRGEAPG